MNDMKIEEYKMLRQEHENNRKHIFERPLLIVVGTIAASYNLSEKSILGLLPIMFLSLLLFNIWFTYNRISSSARIIGYIQLVHEVGNIYKWIGWENSLRLYREYNYKITTGEVKTENYDIKQFQGMAFYAPIYYFHIFIGLVFTIVINVYILINNDTKTTFNIRNHNVLFVALNIIWIIVYMLFLLKYRPNGLPPFIEKQRYTWERVFTYYKLKISG